MSTEKSPYDPNTPEWQLWQVMTSTELLVVSHVADAERSLAKAEAARAKVAQYRAALDKLASNTRR